MEQRVAEAMPGTDVVLSTLNWTHVNLLLILHLRARTASFILASDVVRHVLSLLFQSLPCLAIVVLAAGASTVGVSLLLLGLARFELQLPLRSFSRSGLLVISLGIATVDAILLFRGSFQLASFQTAIGSVCIVLSLVTLDSVHLNSLPPTHSFFCLEVVVLSISCGQLAPFLTSKSSTCLNSTVIAFSKTHSGASSIIPDVGMFALFLILKLLIHMKLVLVAVDFCSFGSLLSTRRVCCFDAISPTHGVTCADAAMPVLDMVSLDSSPTLQQLMQTDAFVFICGISWTKPFLLSPGFSGLGASPLSQRSI